MAYLTRRAQKDIQALPPPLQAKVMELIQRLDSEPSLGKKLKGKLQGLRSTNVGRSHRILYSVGETGVVVRVVRPRKDVYR